MFRYVQVFLMGLLNFDSLRYVLPDTMHSWMDGMETFATPFYPLLEHPLVWYADATNCYPKGNPKTLIPFWRQLQKDMSARGIGFYMPVEFYFVRTLIIGAILMFLWAIPLVLLFLAALALPLAACLGGSWLVFKAVGLV